MFLIVIILLDLKLISSVDDQPYCSIRYRRLCQGKGQHVACQFTSSGPGLSCQNYSQIEFTSDLRHFITNYINRRRQKIASGNERVRGGARLPRPEVMMIVGWDRELAHLAQRLADQCHFVHDDCRATVRYPYAGQSVGEVRWRRSRDSDEMTSQRAIRRVLDAWWGEKRRVLPKQLIAPFRPPTNRGTVWGHFSQLAVWTLRAVGCGAVRHGLEYSRLLLVCDFSHTNMLGQKTINAGPLIACPMHTARRPRSSFPLLCSPVRRPTTPDYAIQENGDNYGNDDNNDDFDDAITAKVKNVKLHTKDVEETVGNKYRYKFETTMEDDDGTVKMNDDRRMSYLVKVQKKTTYSIIDRLQLELESNNDKQQRQPLKIHPKEGYTKVIPKRPYFERLRENLEFREETNLQKATPTYEDDDDTPDYDKLPKTKLNTATRGFNSKQWWKQSRSRPQRPGLNALLNRAPEKNLRRSSLCSLMLDKEDVDQLFQDTGFKVNWRKLSSPR